MCVIISIEKSLISHNGCCEFAKRFIIKRHENGGKDVSPASSSCLLLAYSSLAAALFSTLGCTFNASFRLRGAGYRTLAKLDKSNPARVFGRLSRRWKRHWLSLHSSSGLTPLPFSLWLAFPERGLLSCYEVGMVRWFLLEKAKPKDLDERSLYMLRLFWVEGEEALEFFLGPLVQSHLRHVKWYAETLLDYDAPLESLFGVPSPKDVHRTSSIKS